jgi:putative ABC transport system permease protein
MRALQRILKRTRNFAGSRRGDTRLREEMEAHLAMEAEENVRAGMSPMEARRQARLKFGAVEAVREQYHAEEGLPLLESLVQDTRFSLRQLRRSPGFTLTVVLTLTLGIGATTAIFTLVYATLLRSLPYPAADRIVAIHDTRISGQSTGGLMSVPRYFDLLARNRSFASMGFFFFDQSSMIAGNRLPMAVQAAGTNAAFWNVLGTRPMLGRTFDARDDQPKMPETVVLSYSGWQKLFGGNPGVLHEPITLDGAAATIVGVMPPGVDAPSGIDMWHTAQFASSGWNYRGEGVRFINVFARLRPGVTTAMAESDLNRIGVQLQGEYPQTDGVWRFTSESLRNDRYGALRPALVALQMAAAILLLIACINVANLLLSRGTARQREVAVRRALGASAGRIARQFLTESVVLAMIGGATGLAAAWVLVHGAAAKLPGRLSVPGTVEMRWQVAALAAAVSMLTGIAFGFVPAVESGKVELNRAMKRGEARMGGSGHRLRGALVAAQAGLSLVLLVGAALLGESLWQLVRTPLGFEPDHLLTFSVKLPWDAQNAAITNFYDAVQRRIEALPGVVAVGQISALPTRDWHLRSSFDADWLPRIPSQPAINAEDRSIAGNFLGAMRVALLQGRTFTDADTRLPQSPVLVNQALAQRFLPGGSPIGRHLLAGGESHEIVGVIANVRGTAGSLSNPVGPEVYWPADSPGASAQGRSFVVRTEVPPATLVHSIREQVHAVDPRQAIGDVATMDELLDKSVAQPRLNMAVVAAFAGIALLLACVGIYGVVAYFVAQRTQEIGVRIALGATRNQIAWLFLRRAMVPAIAGVAAGTGLALAAGRLLSSQLYGVQVDDPRIYAASAAVLLVPVLVAAMGPALRAAKMNPMDALRIE